MLFDSLTSDLILPGRIIFGWGRRVEAGEAAASLGRRAFLVEGSRTLRKSPVYQQILESLQQKGIEVVPVAMVTREPTVSDVDQAAAEIRKLQLGQGDFVLGIGGGAALDLAKALAAMATNHQGASVRDYLEGVGIGLTLENDPLPVMAMPTTSGTGSEATKNAVISVDDPPCKKSLRSSKLMPAVVLVDPELTVSCSPQQTAACGMDALTQLLESVMSKRSQPATESWCYQALESSDSLLQAYENGNDRTARERMSFLAFVSGLALANSGLGMAHGVAAALGSICDVPHGLACAVLLPMALKTNRDHAPEVFEKLRSLLPFNQPEWASSEEPVLAYVEHLLRSMSISPRLCDLGVRREQIPLLVTGSRGNSMNGNPRDLSDEELTQILEAHWS